MVTVTYKLFFFLHKLTQVSVHIIKVYIRGIFLVKCIFSYLHSCHIQFSCGIWRELDFLFLYYLNLQLAVVFYIYTCIFAVVFLLLCEIGLYGLKSNMYLIIYVFIDIQEYDTTDARKICFINLYFFPLMSIWCNQILWASHIDCYTWLGQRFFDWLIRMNIGHILCNYHSTTHQACSAQRVLAWIAIFFVTNIGNFGKCLQAPSLLNTLLVFIECLASFFFNQKNFLNLHLLVPLRHYGIF